MKKMRVMVIKYGYALIEAETDDDAVKQTENMNDSDFDWTAFDEAQVVDDEIDF